MRRSRMSRAFVDKTARELERLATGIVWKQWRAIGGSASATEAWHTIVDPEALILASLFFKDRETRIDDILFSWVEANATLLSVQHLKNLQKAFPEDIQERVPDFASRARILAKHPRWDALSEKADDATNPALPKIRRAIRAPAGQASNLLLRLRLAMGVGVKADVMAVILGTVHPVTIRALADSLSYTLVGTRNAVDDLSRAGFIGTTGGKPSAYIAPRDGWQSLLGLKTRPRWVTWHHCFAFVIDYMLWCERPRTKELGDYALDVKIREIIARHDVFVRSAAIDIGTSAVQQGVGSYAAVLETLITWMQRQDGGAAGT